MKNCTNHPDKEALSFCHNCGKEFCSGCLDEGKEFYYCRNPGCQKALRRETGAEKHGIEAAYKVPPEVVCPNCNSALELSEEERLSGIAECPECAETFDFSADPPEAVKYVELLSSLNQGDIALLKSILGNSGIRYYIYGENFLHARPLLEPARFFVKESQLQEARELLKDFDFHIWGTSNNQ
jgi:hypothetical protein